MAGTDLRSARFPALDLFHFATLVATYLIAVLLYPLAARGDSSAVYFTETYFGCIGASIVLSCLAPFLRVSGWLHFVLLLRCYVLIVMGYSLGSFSSVRLVLGVGLMVEACFLEDSPFDYLVAGAAIAALAGAQLFPSFLGPNALAGEVPQAHTEDTISSILVFCFAAWATSRIRRLEVCRRESGELSRIQEANLDALAELNLNLQGYARTIDEESTERERNRISREIHDISGYIFTNLIALMDAAGSMVQANRVGLAELLFTARNQAQEGLRETRAALRRLRDEQARITDCTQAIFKIASIFKKVTKVHVDVNFGNLPHFLPQTLSMSLYRTVQEALTNAVRHGKATRIRVSFWVADDELRLTILDNGKGAYEIVKGIGLRGMEERIGGLGGKVRFGQAAEGGFLLSMEIPMLALPAQDPTPSAAAPASAAGSAAAAIPAAAAKEAT